MVRHSLYACARHPIYSGGILIAVSLALLKPTSAIVLACGFGGVWLIIQARLEGIDLVQRLPEYQEYLSNCPVSAADPKQETLNTMEAPALRCLRGLVFCPELQ